MSYPALITKADFPEYTTVSVNIGNHLIDPHIRDAWDYFVEPLLRATEVAALAAERVTWTPELEALFAERIRPVWVLEAYRRLLGLHGVHITPDALEVLSSDINRAPVSGQLRAELKADAQGKLSIQLSRLESALRAYRGPASPTTCGATTTRRRPLPGGARITSA